MSLVAAVDVGGTSIKSALVNSSLEILSTASTPTPKDDFDGTRTVVAIHDLIAQLSEDGEVEAVGLAVPGIMDEERGIALWAGNLQWRNLPIRDLLYAQLNIPIAFGHDVRSGAIAELRAGAAKGKKDAIFIPVGTGIAAALIIDGEIRNSGGFAGEIGHLDVGHDRLCVCGKIGCLEAISSALSISNAYSDLSKSTGKNAEDILHLALAGDSIAQSVWSDATAALAKACQSLITILAPEVIIFGGGVSGAGTALINPISTALDDLLTFQRKPELSIAHFGTQSGTIGCAIMALDLLTIPTK